MLLTIRSSSGALPTKSKPTDDVNVAHAVFKAMCVYLDHLDIKYTSVLDPWLLHRNQTVEFTTSRALAAQQRAFQQNEGTVECKSIIYLWSQFRRLYSFGFSLTLVD